MKFTKSKIITAMFAALFALALLAPGPDAQAQVTNVAYGSFTNGVVTVTNGATVTVTTDWVPVRKGRGMAILPYFVGLVDPTAANETFTFQVSYDGTNATTTSPFTLAVGHNSTTPVRGYTNFPPSLLDNVSHIRWWKVANGGTNTIYVSNVVWSASN